MSVDKRQKKLEKRKAKSKAKQKKVRQSSSSWGEAKYIREGLKNPIAECMIDNSGAQEGMRQLMITKMSGLRVVVVGAFIVDTYCLGVKNCFIRPGTVEQHKANMAKRPFEKIKPEDAKKLLLDVIEWSRRIGFEPHKDFKKVFKILDEINADDSDAEFEFGHEGKPFFIAGPFDSPAKCKKITDTLEKNCGEVSEAFDFMMPNSAMMNFDEEEGRWEGSENI